MTASRRDGVDGADAVDGVAPRASAGIREARDVRASEAGDAGGTKREETGSLPTATDASDRGRGTSVRGATRVGRLEVGPAVIGYGSCGTVVFEGALDGRPVAVKRLLAHFHELARAELRTLIASDEHPNILRCFAMEEDDDFVYVALERCSCTLASLVAPEKLQQPGTDRMDQNAEKPFAFVDARTNRPTPEGLRLMRDAFAGVNALHAVGVVHRDLKPQNVLVTPRRRGKLADMGLAKKLNAAEGTSFETRPAAPPRTGPDGAPLAPSASGGVVGGTAGWLAPERLAGERQSRAVDAFGLGCLLHYCLTGGGHPFGARYERDANVARGVEPELDALERVSREAADLARALTLRDPKSRPTAAEALAHPLWWSDAKKLAFLCDVSDRVEMEDREAGGALLLRELERGALPGSAPGIRERGGGSPRAPGGIGIVETSWAGKLPPSLLQNLGKYRSYKGDETRDLLRVIRNKSNHFRELPKNVRDEVGAPPEGFYRYFDEKFPRLLLHTYAFVKDNCAHEPAFRAYFFPPRRRWSTPSARARRSACFSSRRAGVSSARGATSTTPRECTGRRQICRTPKFLRVPPERPGLRVHRC